MTKIAALKRKLGRLPSYSKITRMTGVHKVTAWRAVQRLKTAA